jgi:hypothetical protein
VQPLGPGWLLTLVFGTVGQIEFVLSVVRIKGLTCNAVTGYRLKNSFVGGGGWNFVGCAIWVQNLVSHFEGGTQTEGF